MATAPKKVADRLVTGIKRLQPVLAAVKARDIGESAPVTIVTDMLAEVFGCHRLFEDVQPLRVSRGVALARSRVEVLSPALASQELSLRTIP